MHGHVVTDARSTHELEDGAERHGRRTKPARVTHDDVVDGPDRARDWPGTRPRSRWQSCFDETLTVPLRSESARPFRGRDDGWTRRLPACIALEAGCFSSFRTPFLLGGIFDETEEKPIRRLSAADPTPFLHDTLTDTAIAAMEKRNEYLRFCREISTISIPDLSLPRQMRRGNRKGIRGAATVPSSLRS